ncbi:MAG: ABC transporter ATP-binding protein [Planctomycetes bacterium]|nr:ABC transporter ATP-binding protein [Planctomycetota bacterium]
MNDRAASIATAIRTAWTLECRSLVVAARPRTLLHDINLRIQSGECVFIIGPNGAGKTTLLHALLGIRRPNAGTVSLNGVELHRLSARRRGQFAAYVPQTLEHAPQLSVREVVSTGRFPHLPPLRPLSREDERIVSTALDVCGLAALAERPFPTISGGERQKTLLAAALAQAAPSLFLDEPDTALDPAYQIELVRILQRIRAEGRTLVIVSHDLQFPAALGGRVIAMRAGRLAADGPAAEILDPTILNSVYGTTFETAMTPSGRRLVIPHW